MRALISYYLPYLYYSWFIDIIPWLTNSELPTNSFCHPNSIQTILLSLKLADVNLNIMILSKYIAFTIRTLEINKDSIQNKQHFDKPSKLNIFMSFALLDLIYRKMYISSNFSSAKNKLTQVGILYSSFLTAPIFCYIWVSLGNKKIVFLWK